MAQDASSKVARFEPYDGLPLPQPTWDNHEFWDYCRQHELRIQRCGDCGEHRYYPRPTCPVCNSRAFTWERMSEKGTVHSYTVVYPPVLPYFADKVPMPVAVVKLDEGEVYMVGRLMGLPPEDARIGLRVEVAWEDVSEEISLPQWRRA